MTEAKNTFYSWFLVQNNLYTSKQYGHIFVALNYSLWKDEWTALWPACWSLVSHWSTVSILWTIQRLAVRPEWHPLIIFSHKSDSRISLLLEPLSLSESSHISQNLSHYASASPNEPLSLSESCHISQNLSLSAIKPVSHYAPPPSQSHDYQPSCLSAVFAKIFKFF